MNVPPTHNPTTAPRLCDALGLETGSFDRFLTQKDEAFAERNAEAEQYARKALVAELLWAE